MLKRVSIQNFKSLKDVTLDLQKVNLLIGPNNSGKTNFLKALEFCCTTTTIPEVFIENPTPEKKLYYEQERERFSHLVYQKDQSSLIKIDLNSGDLVNAIYSIHWSANTRFGKHIVDNTDTGLVSNGVFEDLKTYLRYIYKPDPNKLLRPGPVGRGEEIVNADASNIVGFLDLMLSKYRRTTFGRIETDLHTCIPEFDEVNLDDAQPTEELKRQFVDKSFKRIGLANSKQGITYWADELSEGTLYFLALLCIINQPNPPKLLLLEEPEKGIHPRRIEEVINFIFGLADDKDVQVIMTTHSPAVVDMFKDMPESVFIFDKDEEGATHVINLQKDIIEPETAESEKAGFDPPRYLNGLGEAWKVGFLGGVPR